MRAGVRSGGTVTSHIELASDVVEAGSQVGAELVIQNDSGEPLEIRDRGCAPKWAIGIDDRTEAPEAFTMDCQFSPLVVPAGTSRHRFTLSATYRACGAFGPACLPDAPRIPPLPPGEYEVKRIGVLPGVPSPKPVEITVVESLTADE